MSRFLHRPMFRRGGSADGGITSGLRQGYNRGRVVNPGGYKGDEEFNLSDYLSEQPELPRSSAGADFWLNLGTSILAQPGGRPILQTLGTAGQEPLKQFQQQRSKENLLKYKHAQGERQFQLEIYKALSDKDKIALAEKIDYLMEEHGITKEEALNRALPEFRKPRHPDEQKLLDTEYEREQIDKDAEGTRRFLSAEEGVNVSIPQARVINEFYDQAHAQKPVWMYDDIPFIDKTAIAQEWSDAGKKPEVWQKDGNIAIPPDLQSNYKEGLYYVDHFNGDVYRVGVGSTELIKIDLTEIKIN